VARRTFYGHFPNKHALLGGLGVSRVYNQSEPMLRELMANHDTTRDRLEAMIDYIEANFAGYEEIDRQLFLLGPVAFAENREQQREVGSTSMASFTRLISAGRKLGDVKTDFSPEILAALVVGTLNMLTMSWAMDDSYPIFAKLEEARALFESLICK
jgi:AcrR family transcriptional regulator